MVLAPRVPRFTLRLEESGKIEDPQELMRCLYRYWYYKGYWGVTASSLVDALNMCALLIVAVIFTMRFQWDVALRCGESECAASTLVRDVAWPYIFQRTFLGYLFGFVFLVSTAVSFVHETIALVESIYIYREVDDVARSAGFDTGFLTPLHRWRHNWRLWEFSSEGHEAVSLRAGAQQVLTTSTWGSFLEAVCTTLTREKQLKYCAAGDSWDALRAVQALMQRDNFLIALCEGGVLDSGALRHMDPGTIHFLIAATFDPFNTVRSRGECLWAVRERIVKYIGLNLCFYVFIATYSVVKVLVRNAAQVKANFHALSQWEWNSRAAWTFRLYNEVYHLHASRLASGRTVAARMADRLSISNSVSRLVRRVCSICVLVIVTISFINPALLIGGTVAGLSFVWWLTIALLLYAAFTEIPPSEREYAYLGDLGQLSDSIHYSADQWYESGDAFLQHVRRHFLCSRLTLIATDLCQTLCMPLILACALHDGSVEALVDFMQQSSVLVEGVGSVALGAAFERAEDSFEKMSEHDDGGGSYRVFAPADAQTTAGAARLQKIHISIASFSAVYPEWTLHYLDATPQPAGSAGAASGNGGSDSDPMRRSAYLTSFLTDLNNRVSQQLMASQIRNAHPQPSQHPLDKDSSDLLCSCKSHRCAGGQALCLELPHAPTSAAAQGSTIIPFEISSTAHERERLFVSQVMSSTMRRVSSGLDHGSYRRYGASAVASSGRTTRPLSTVSTEEDFDERHPLCP